MYRYIRVKHKTPIKDGHLTRYYYDPENVEFSYALDEESAPNKHFFKLDNSWIISAVLNAVGRLDIVTCCLSNASKTLPPISVIHDLSEFDIVLILKTGTTSWSVSYADYRVWKAAYAIGVMDFYIIDNSVTIPIQVVNGKELNPVLTAYNFDKISEQVEENGFKEHYIKYVKYFRKPIIDLGDGGIMEADMNHPYILQQTQDGSKCLYFPKEDGPWVFEGQQLI